MLINKLYYISIVFTYVLSVVCGDDLRGSLTFVIDDTISMRHDIQQVKEKSFEIFDAVVNSNESVIDEFVIVTFNDPETQVRIVTKDKHDFKKILETIKVGGGGDCPEMSMTGIQKALETSKPHSFLYVFTDASSKDSDLYENVKALSLKKSSQVTFLLTGECKKRDGGTAVVYDELAEATLGQVFHIKRNDVTKIINYIIATIGGKRTGITRKNLNGCDNKIDVKLDSKLWDIFIAVSAHNPEFNVLIPDGADAEIEEFVKTERTKIVKMKAKPGVYSVQVSSCDKSTLVATASTSVIFRHGFSSTMPHHINETSTRPMPDIESYLAIELNNEDRDVTLQSAQIWDVEDTNRRKLPLTLIDEEQLLYITDMFKPPNITFKIAVTGYINKTKEHIIRICPTTIEYQKITENITEKSPKVTFLSNDIVAQYGKPLTIMCKVIGYPKPNIIWEDEVHTVWPSTLKLVELPYEYLSTLQMDTITENKTFTCKANNGEEDSDTMTVTTEKKTFFNVVNYPKDTSVQDGESVELKCEIDAMPPATIAWYRDGKAVTNNENFHISTDGSALSITNIQPELGGQYYLEAYNDETNKNVYNFNIIVTGTEKPLIDKTVTNYIKQEESSVEITCSVIRGKPEPVISWSFDYNSLGKFVSLKETGASIHINHIKMKNIGTYKCIVANSIGKDTHEMRLLQASQPTVTINPKNRVKIIIGETVEITCITGGMPPPKVRWLKDWKEVHNGIKYQIHGDNTLSFTGALEDTGNYICDASNSVGTERKSVQIDMYEPVRIKPPENSNIIAKLMETVTLLCEASGSPKPKIEWTYFSDLEAPRKLPTDADDKSLTITNIQLEHEGRYQCTATTIKGDSKLIQYTVFVPAPASIDPAIKTKHNVVEGDPWLLLKCKNSGSPKPTIKWLFNEQDITLLGDGVEVTSDGSLTISNITSRDTGVYRCHAENIHGNDSLAYEVDVFQYPKLEEDQPSTILIEEGQTQVLFCEGFELNKWYKDGNFLQIGDLTLVNVTRAANGLYSCRYSIEKIFYTIHKQVTVGTKPRLITDVQELIQYENGKEVSLDCRASGDPLPSIRWETDKIIASGVPPKSFSIYTFKMDISHIEYDLIKCVASNRYGQVKRIFKITAGDCQLDLQNGNFASQPMLIIGNRKRQWLNYEIQDGKLVIRKLRKFNLHCPESSLIYDGTKHPTPVETVCVDNSMLRLGKKSLKFSEIVCSEAHKPLAKKLVKQECFGTDTVFIFVGFDVNGSFLSVFTICFHTIAKVPLFAHHSMNRGIAKIVPKPVPLYTRGNNLDLEFEDIYNCEYQLGVFSGRSNTRNTCCFSRRQLVHPMDVLPGISQVATYHYLNVVPQCGTENWDEVEKRVRSYVQSMNENYTMFVWTGAASRDTIPTIYLKDRSSKQLKVPQFIWKVLKGLLAIIHINVPGLRSSETSAYILCKDICDTVEWMKNDQWHDSSKGYIYCCDVGEFETAFGYKNVFK